MPRTFNPAIQGEIDKRFAGEPMILVEVNWVDDAWVAYTDRKLNGAEYPYPLLISISQFDSTRIVTGGSDSQQTTLTFNDIDGTLRNITDNNDVHLRPVRIYLTFQGLPVEEKALMFEGVINSPVTWDEMGRTITMDVLSTIESVEAGFTMEDGDFPFIDPSDRNKPWPLVFGQVCNMQAVTVRGTRKGFLGEGVGVADPTIEERLCQARKLTCPTIQNTVQADQGAGNSQTSDTSGSTGTTQEFANVRQGKVDPQCVNRRFNKICEILTEREQQGQYVKDSFIVRGGDDFPQNQLITIQINEVKFSGTMSGETFSVKNSFYPNPPDNPPCVDAPEAGWGFRWGPDADDNPDSVQACGDGSANNDFSKDVVGGASEVWEYFAAFKRADFIWLPPGTQVLLAEEAEVLNIVSLLPGTVNQVAAYRNFSDTALLTTVPTDLYTVQTTDYGGYDVVEIVLDAPLSTVDTDGLATWDDEIYVSFTSSIGPNPADIIQWLVETYTDFTVDAASFAAVQTSLTKYPMGFFRKSRPRVLDLIRDVAFQARCGIFIRDNVVHLVYLSTEPTSVDTITDSDILPNSFRITHTGTEDLETRSTISWSEGEAGIFKTDETDFEFVIKHNVPKYGIFDASYNYYTMNIFELVEKSATFWSIRNSNTWKHVEFQTPLTKLNLDLFDAVTINTSQFGPVKVVIEQAIYNIDSNTISFKAWTPIRGGEETEYLWAWPSQQDPAAIHPQPAAVGEAGDGFALQVIPPEGHPLRGAYDPDTSVLNTDGDKHPSDLDDTLPTLICKVSTGNEIADDIEPVFDPFEPLAEANFNDKLDNIESGNQTSYSLEDAEGENACGDSGPANGGCVYEVTIHYITPAAVTNWCEGGTQSCQSGCPHVAGPCGCGCPGRPCFGSQSTFCHSFGALFAATSFQSQKAYEARVLHEQALYQCGVTNILSAGSITGIEGTGPEGFNECEEASESNPGGDPGAPGADAGETQKPKCKAGGCADCLNECTQANASETCDPLFAQGGSEWQECVAAHIAACKAACVQAVVDQSEAN